MVQRLCGLGESAGVGWEALVKDGEKSKRAHNPPACAISLIVLMIRIAISLFVRVLRLGKDKKTGTGGCRSTSEFEASLFSLRVVLPSLGDTVA
jgi:hypothetical protein